MQASNKAASVDRFAVPQEDVGVKLKRVGSFLSGRAT